MITISLLFVLSLLFMLLFLGPPNMVGERPTEHGRGAQQPIKILPPFLQQPIRFSNLVRNFLNLQISTAAMRQSSVLSFFKRRRTESPNQSTHSLNSGSSSISSPVSHQPDSPELNLDFGISDGTCYLMDRI